MLVMLRCESFNILKVKDHMSNPQFLPIFHYKAALKRIVVSGHLVSVLATSSVPHFAVFIGTNACLHKLGSC